MTRFALGESFVVDAKRSPEPQNVICQERWPKVGTMVWIVYPILFDDFFSNVGMHVSTEKRFALKEQEKPGSEGVGVVVLRRA